METLGPQDDTVLLCPLCARKHRLKTTKKGGFFFNCPSMSFSTNVFFDTPESLKRLQEWRRDARIIRPEISRRGIADKRARTSRTGVSLADFYTWSKERRR